MKKLIILTIGLMLILSSCDRGNNSGNPDTKLIDVTLNAGLPSTRVSVDNLDLYWTEGDKFKLLDDVTPAPYEWEFTLAEGAYEMTGQFTGTIASNPSRTKFYATYPIGFEEITPTSAGLSISNTQKQTNEPDSFGNYMRGIASTDFSGDPSESNPLALTFQLVNTIWDIEIASNPDNAYITSVTISADDDKTPFVGKGTVDLTKTYADNAIIVNPTKNYTSFSASFGEGINTKFVSRITFLPSYFDGVNLSISASTHDQNVSMLRYGMFKKFKSNTRYSSKIHFDTSITQKDVFLNQDFSGIEYTENYPSANSTNLTEGATFASPQQIVGANVQCATGWTGSWIFGANEVIKVGDSTNTEGSILITPAIFVPDDTKNLALRFSAAAFPGSSTTLNLEAIGCDLSTTSVTLLDGGSNNMQQYQININNASNGLQIKFISEPSSAFFIDNIVVEDAPVG